MKTRKSALGDRNLVGARVTEVRHISVEWLPGQECEA